MHRWNKVRECFLNVNWQFAHIREIAKMKDGEKQKVSQAVRAVHM